ncbi:MAG TPA: serine hydrolase domain-containing protein [Roseiflexaceae bacterium]|nr:serine hydrolase domain-containing protein [Roseiflexaceae bacterium]
MSEQAAQAAVRAAVSQVLDAGQVPGIVVAVARGAATPWCVAVGSDADGRALEQDTLFPVASVTKMATGLVVHRLVERGDLHLDDLLSDHLPAAAAAQRDVTLRTLLCHTSGMPLDVPESEAPYAAGLSWDVLRGACLQTPLEAPPNTRVQYSNAGYGLIGAVVERVTGQAFADALADLVLAPLGIEAYLGSEPPRQPARLAKVRSRHAGTALEPYNTPFWRSLALPWGGLYTTAAGALAIVRAYADHPAGLLRSATRAEAIADHTGGLAGGFAPPLMWNPCPWGLGPEVRGTKDPHWVTPHASSASFGHSGASGCLAWCDPAAELAFAILGARPADSGWLLRRGPAITEAIYQL